MITFFEATLTQLAVHQVGNKSKDEPCTLSKQPLIIEDETLQKILMQYFLTSFEKVNEIYHFSHANDDLNLNEVFHFSEMIFADPECFLENSQQLAKHLHNISVHPKIKSGELYIALFNNLQIDGELNNAIGIFKSETKETYLKVSPEQAGFALSYEQEAINIKKLDKGCLIFNAEKEQGYKVAIIDQTNKSGETVYWIDEFLQLKVRNDDYNQTHTTLSVYKSFVTNKIDEEFDISNTDKIDLLNRSLKYFKEKDNFDLDEFSNEVIGYPEGIESFKNYKKSFEQEFQTEIQDSFQISDAAVKKQARIYKSILKLDKNFHIYIHGSKDLIEKGFDEEKNMNYYKVYFREETQS